MVAAVLVVFEGEEGFVDLLGGVSWGGWDMDEGLL